MQPSKPQSINCSSWLLGAVLGLVMWEHRVQTLQCLPSGDFQSLTWTKVTVRKRIYLLIIMKASGSLQRRRLWRKEMTHPVWGVSRSRKPWLSMKFYHTNSYFFKTKSIWKYKSAYMAAIFFFFVFYSVPYPFQDDQWKGREKNKQRTLHWLLYFQDSKDPWHPIYPATFLAGWSWSSWRTVRTQSSVFWLLPPGLAAASGSRRFPVAQCWCRSSKMEALTFKKEEDEKKGSEGVGGLWMPIVRGQRPVTYDNFK